MFGISTKPLLGPGGGKDGNGDGKDCFGCWETMLENDDFEELKDIESRSDNSVDNDIFS